MRALLVVNPKATATTHRIRDILLNALGREISVEVAETERRGHAITLAEKARADGIETVIALGGDGTVNEVVNGLLAAGIGSAATGADAGTDTPTLGVIPGGSANVFSRALGFSRDPLQATSQLLDAIRSGRTRRINLGRVESRWFIFNAGFGFDAEVIERVERSRVAGHEATPGLYLRSTVGQLLRGTDRRHPTITLVDGHDGAVDGIFAAIIANAAPWTYLGPRAINLVPAASFDSGLDLLATRTMNPLRMAAIAGKVTLAKEPRLRGRALLQLHDLAEFTLTSTVPRPVQVDGDFLGRQTSVTFTSEARAIRVIDGPGNRGAK